MADTSIHGNSQCQLVGVDVEDMEYDSYSAIYPGEAHHVMVKVFRYSEKRGEEVATGSFVCEECGAWLGFNSDGIVVESENA